ncbi:MAG: hypothetical protein KAT62_12450 [Desulfuromonadales bacterium]|nr:hypothetical protein [Desulfuromonadales bacterium]
METGYSNRGGWFSDQPNSTGDSSYLSSIPRYVMAVGLLVSAGTGAFADDLSQLQQQRANDLSAPVRVYACETAPVRTSIDNIVRIREVLCPAMSDLAKAFNVSRQTIYNWLNGGQATPEHASRLKDLALVADMFSEVGVPVNGVLLKRKVIEGKNLFEIVRDGGSVQGAAQLLLRVVKHETNQRERLASRFSGRSISQHSADTDVIAENDMV